MATQIVSSKVLDIFIPINKIDEEQRLVYGQVAAEVEDNSGEIFDYDGSKPYFQEWSDNAFSTSGGKSYGNVRVMHTSKVAGLIPSPLKFDDDAKTIEAVAKVVDDDEWKMVLAGGYTGFSMGGRYVQRMAVGEEKRYIAAPVEVSLVDKPCIPTAVFFDVIKADGIIERREFLNKAVPVDDTDANPERRADEPAATRRGGQGKFRGKTEAENHGGSDPTGHGVSEATATTKSDNGDIEMRIPTNDEVLPYAKALAKAAGNEDAWLDHVADARERMQKGEYGDAWMKPGSVEHVVVDEKAKTKGVDGHDDHDNPNATRGTGAGGAPVIVEGEQDVKGKDDHSSPDASRKGDMPDAIKDKIDAKAEKTDDHEDGCKCDKCMDKADKPASEGNSEGEAVSAASAEKAAGLKQVWQTSDGRSFSKKADASEHEDKLAKAADPNSLTGLLKAATALVEDITKSDDMEYADEANSKYPIDNEKHIRAAWSYINMPKNQKSYSSAEVSAIKGKIVAAWKSKIDKDGPPSAATKADVTEFAGVVGGHLDRLRKFADSTLLKGMYAVSRLAGIIDSLSELHRCVCFEEECEGDGSSLPAALLASLKSLGDNLVAMADEEVKEMVASRGMGADAAPVVVEVLELAASTLGLQKADLELDLQKRIGTVRPTGDYVTKADFDQIVAENTVLKADVAEAVPMIKTLMADMERIKSMPMPMRRPQTLVVEKAADGTVIGTPSGEPENLLTKYTTEQLTDAAIRLSQQQGRAFIPGGSSGGLNLR